MVQLEYCLQLSAKAVPKAPSKHTTALPVMLKLCKSPRLGDVLSVHVRDIQTDILVVTHVEKQQHGMHPYLTAETDTHTHTHTV